MALSASTAAGPISSAYTDLLTTPPYTGTLGSTWATACLDWSTAGVLSGGGGVAGGEDSSIIQGFIDGLTGNTTPSAFAVAMASYWATCLIVPAGNATAVTNDALAQVSAFEAAINASVGATEKTPYFQHLFENIQTIALPTITWTVVRSTPPSPTLETVS
jgi:hypothetical protein